jgi:hypothetical protein
LYRSKGSVVAVLECLAKCIDPHRTVSHDDSAEMGMVIRSKVRGVFKAKPTDSQAL